ncbi:MAG: hypothetical protein HY706_11245 [Candidatus Hydrogenedentes bacterium]|nr:hypothetical protein [Candidatus Hydrogenedentota bacterium]
MIHYGEGDVHSIILMLLRDDTFLNVIVTQRKYLRTFFHDSDFMPFNCGTERSAAESVLTAIGVL